MRNGFPPAILSDPNRFDLFSRNELLNEILLGMENTFTLINKNELYGVNTANILTRIQNSPSLNYFNELEAIEMHDRQRPCRMSMK